MKTFYQLLFRQVDASALSVFRIGLGAILFFDCVNYGLFLCLQCDYHDTDLLFKYAGFEWVQPLPTVGLKILWLLMGVCALGIMLGLFYRFCMIAFTLGFTYQFLLDEALYLNHFYMVILFCALMCFIPANRHWALDVLRNPEAGPGRPIQSNWPRFLLGAQLEIILIHAGLVKINADWLNLEPLRMWLTARSANHGELLQLLTQDWGIAVAAYSAILLHLVGAPLLLFRSTRLYVLAVYTLFHITNAFVFNIGIFPWFTLFASLLLFDPDWPVALWNKLRWNYAGIRERFPTVPFRHIGKRFDGRAGTVQHLIALAIAAWLLVQIVVPFRHWWLDGNVAWNENGHRYSWRMKLRSKRGDAQFIVRAQNANGRFRWAINPADVLNNKQARKIPCIPDMVWQFAQHLQLTYQHKGYDKVSVFADIKCSLNGRKAAQFIRTDVDLTQIGRYEPLHNWIVPLQEELPNPFLSRVAGGFKNVF